MKASQEQVVNRVFDLGNVLVRWDPVAIVRSVIDGPGAVRLAEHIFAHPDWVSVDRGTLTLEQAAERAIERTDVDDAIIHAAVAAVAPSRQPLPESVALLDAVVAQGHSLYALSNMGHVSADYLQLQASFWPKFKDVVISARVGLVKPEPAIFELMLAQFGLASHECLFIDDSLDNVQAAQALGIDAIHFTGASQCRNELVRRGLLID